MKLVTISGLDGSGKSTQINLLKEYLESQGQRVFYFHTNQFSIGKAYNVLRPHKVISGTHNKSVAKANFWQIYLRKIALAIDLWRFKLLRNKLRNSGYDYILSDRFFHDTLINISYLENNNLETKNWKLIENLKFKIENYLFIYLQTAPEMIMQRKRTPDQGLEYLQKKKELYDQFTEVFGMKIIDGNRSQEKIFTEIKNLL